MKITKITQIGPSLYAHICPLCGAIHASMTEAEYMPEFSICDCDQNTEKDDAYELFSEDGCTMIRRNKPPRFVGKVTFGIESDIEEIQWLDITTPLDMAKAMRKAGEFLMKSSKSRNK